MVDSVTQCLLGGNQQMRSDTLLGGEGGGKEMGVGDGPPAQPLAAMPQAVRALGFGE